MIELRDSQELAIDLIRKSYAQRNKRTILNGATGFGKTVTAAALAKLTLDRGNNIIFLVHRVEILQQFFKTFGWFGITPSLIVPGRKIMPGQQIYLGMVETYRARLKKNPNLTKALNPQLVVCDEVHWGSYESVVNGLMCRVLGLSATPKSASGKDLKDYFDDCVCPVSVSDLIRQGELCMGSTYSIDYNFSKLKISGKDFARKQLEAEFSKPTLFNGALEEYQRHCDGAKAICYSVSVEASIAQSNLFKDAGYKCWHVDATSEYRDEIFKEFGKSKHGILFNVGIATTGYDEPSVECIIENFATAQVTKHHQVIGRGGRTSPETGKKGFTIIDMGRNYMRHGLYGEGYLGGKDVDWIGIFNNPRLGKTKKEESITKNIECKLCGALITIRSRQCPYCGIKITDEDIKEHIMEKGDTKEIKAYRLQSLPVQLRGRKPGTMSYTEIHEYAKHMGYKKQWANMQLSFRRKNK